MIKKLKQKINSLIGNASGFKGIIFINLSILVLVLLLMFMQQGWISKERDTLISMIDKQTIDKKVKLKIPSGTQTHTNFRIKDNGIKHLNSTNKGDLYVRVIIETPNKLTKHEKEFYKEYIGKQENKGFFKSLFE